MSGAALSVVVIGRNEGSRLTACLESIGDARALPQPVEVIYVDSNSSDGSPERAAGLGAKVIALGPGPQSAARARNAGWRMSTAPNILFLDGDTILDPDFVARALQELEHPRAAVVCGRRRETRPEASLYNRVLDLDWIFPPGFADFCGGDALMRRAALEQVDGYDANLIAGEEPDMCRRMRAAGHRVVHIDAPMTGHDLAILKFSQYWRRAIRSGYAYAEIAARYRHTPDPLWSKESRANALRGSLYLFSGLGLGVASLVLRSWVPLLMGAIGLAALAIRTARSARWKGASAGTLLWYGLHSHVQHIPIMLGQILYWWRRRRGQDRRLIEYKAGPL